MTKHYIRIDNDKNIIKAYSDQFEQFVAKDICVNENASRHYHLNILNSDGLYNYKWDGSKIIEKTETQKYTLDVLKRIKINELKSIKWNKVMNFEAKYDIIKTEYDTKRTEINNCITKTQLNNIEL